MVVLGHFSEKVKKLSDPIIYRYFMPKYIYILPIQSSSHSSLDQSHRNQNKEKWTKEMEDEKIIPWTYYGDLDSYEPLTKWVMMQLARPEAESIATKCNLI